MDEKLRSKLCKILALTTSPQEGEAQAAAHRLAIMLEQHNLDIADLEKKGAPAPGVREQRHDLGKAAFRWKLRLAEQVAQHYYCFALVDDRRKRVALVGRPDNVESLQMLYSWLIDQVRRIATEERRHHLIRTNEHIDPLRWQVAFGEGAASRLGERLQELRVREATEAGTALVLSRSAEISDFLEQHYGYRVDGRMTKRQQEWEAEWKAWRDRMRLLKETDIEAYYRECPWNRPLTPEQQAAQDAAMEQERRREAKNAKRRKPRESKVESWEEMRRRLEREAAEQSGYDSADRVNLQPFLTGNTQEDELASLPARKLAIGC